MIQDFISKLSEQEKKILYATIAFVVLAVFDRLLLGPATSWIKSLDEQIMGEKNTIKSDLRLLSYRDRILDENKVLEEYYIFDAKTEEEIIAAFLKKIEILATESHVNLIKASPSDVLNKKGYIEYYANLESDGKFSDMVSFMHAMDTSDDLLKIVKLNLSPKRASGEEVSATITVVKILVDLDSVEEAKKILNSLQASSMDRASSKLREDDVYSNKSMGRGSGGLKSGSVGSGATGMGSGAGKTNKDGSVSGEGGSGGRSGGSEKSEENGVSAGGGGSGVGGIDVKVGSASAGGGDSVDANTLDALKKAGSKKQETLSGGTGGAVSGDVAEEGEEVAAGNVKVTQPLSERFSVKNVKKSKTSSKKKEEVDPELLEVKPSIFEKFIGGLQKKKEE